MSAKDLSFTLPADFESRCTAVYARLQAGEPMTVEYLADQLGLPYEFFAGALAAHAASLGALALVDLSPPRPLH
ncbi:MULTISPECIES: hypothetical protein [unclassified Bradyrhizobium]|uniref:hypothetical protein n=1 Tax=unclassified Bradyrhizobium TaxID=2631580 RepID=UPI002916C5B7|nr:MULTISPECIES: hypothetical protein [unclassified Bradyrhizobium]